MATQIINAAPMVIDLGTQDLSGRQVPIEPEALPQHLPKFWLFAQKGPLTPVLVAGGDRDRIYGTDSFDLRGKYANHATVFANLANAEGNACMIQRVIADDAGPEATIVLWLDVLETDVDVFERNADGSIKFDTVGNPVITGTTTGHKVKWVATYHPDKTAIQNFGGLTIQTGDQTDPVSGNQSQRYPIMEIKAMFPGEYYNTCGIRLWAPTLRNSENLPYSMMESEKAYPFMMSVIRKDSATGTPKPVSTIFGENSIMFTFKQNVVDPTTDKLLFIGDQFPSAYQNITDPRYPIEYGDFGALSLYKDNIDLLLTKFHAAEIPFIDQFSDFTADPEDRYLFNFITGETSQGTPYHSFQFVDDVNAVTLSEYTNVYARGGSDGTIDNTTFANLVKSKVMEYQDTNSELMDLAVNVESIIYDSGFPLDVKKEMASFISQRKDTFVVLGTHTVDGPTLSASEEYSMAIALRTRLQFYPESSYFGTPVMRGMVVGRSGYLRNSQYTKRLPLTAEVLIKAARYMGASNGQWKSGKNFDGAPGSIVENMYDINITWVPNSVRNRNWDAGLNFVLHYDRSRMFFPALKTVYSDDTSVLNSFITAMAICYINKITHAAWREFSGVANLTNAQLIERVNAFVESRLKDRFDGRFVVQPDATITESDALRGYSWTLPVKIYANNMKTVMTTYVQAYRMEDLPAA